MRTYRVSRIEELTILDRFERPDGFDLAEYWDRSVAAYAGSLPRFAATVKLRGDGIERLAQVVGEGQARQALAGAAGPDQDGWLTISMSLEDLWHAEANLLSLGADAEVVEPAALRERVAAAARAVASIYG
jgi:predicted DNA-binding transcriptional regulator YafY